MGIENEGFAAQASGDVASGQSDIIMGVIDIRRSTEQLESAAQYHERQLDEEPGLEAGGNIPGGINNMLHADASYGFAGRAGALTFDIYDGNRESCYRQRRCLAHHSYIRTRNAQDVHTNPRSEERRVGKE